MTRQGQLREGGSGQLGEGATASAPCFCAVYIQLPMTMAWRQAFPCCNAVAITALDAQAIVAHNSASPITPTHNTDTPSSVNQIIVPTWMSAFFSERDRIWRIIISDARLRYNVRARVSDIIILHHTDYTRDWWHEPLFEKSPCFFSSLHIRQLGSQSTAHNSLQTFSGSSYQVGTTALPALWFCRPFWSAHSCPQKGTSKVT